MYVSRRLGALFLFLVTAGFALAQETPVRLPGPVAQALQQSGIPAASIGIFVQDTASERVLLAYGDERSLNPASTIKLVTTFAALDLLGPAHAWTTELYTNGSVQGDVLNGDLIIKGYGDPRLTLENFWLMLRALRAKGVRQIRGNLVFDRSYFAPEERDAGRFDGEPTRPYNTPPDALLVNFKAVRLTFAPDAERRALAIAAEPALPQVQILNNVVLDNEPCGDWISRLKLTVLDEVQSARMVFSGNYSVACGERTRNYNVLGHTHYAHAVFAVLWKELGGTLHGVARDGEAAGSRLLATHQTQPLSEIVRDINKFSNNVMARQLYLAMGALMLGAPATSDKSARAIRQWLAGRRLTIPELVLENGSGLSRNERISARSLGTLLQVAYRSAVMPEFMSSLPLVAVDGTMRRRLTSADIAGQAHVKTGTLVGVRAIAGYVLDSRGRRIIVVCIVNHARAQHAQSVQDALLRWVYAG